MGISIKALLKDRNFNELDKYINSLISKVDNIKLPIICENSSANAIISYYIERANSLSIKTDIQITIPENINIGSLDLNVVFGNCLENAIEACSKLTVEEQRFLNVKAAIVKHYFVINIINSFNGIVSLQNDLICSTKENASNHGIGLESVKTIVSQYNGTFELSYTQNEFVISIIMFNA